MENKLDQMLSHIGDEAVIEKIETVLAGLMGDTEGADEIFGETGIGTYCVSNKSTRFGALIITRPDVKARVSEIFGGSFIVLPSSIHEVLCLADTDRPEDIKEYLEVVRSINRAAVPPEDRFSDNIFRYNAESGKFEVITGEESR